MSELLALAALPMAGATVGALIDEHDHLGFTSWRSACSAAGFSFRSMVTFATELLPSSIAGLLAGGLLLLMLAMVMRRRRGHADRCLAAHTGCVLSMPVGFSLCAFAVPVPAMLLADTLMSFGAAWLMYEFAVRRADPAPPNP